MGDAHRDRPLGAPTATGLDAHGRQRQRSCADSCYLLPEKKASCNTNLQVILADLRSLFAKSWTFCLLATLHPRTSYYAAHSAEGLHLIELNIILWGASFLPVDGVSQIETGQAQVTWLSG